MFNFSLKKIKKQLEEKKKEIEAELKKFAEKDKNLPYDWDTKFPQIETSIGSQTIEDEAEELQEYITKLPIEHSLETRLEEIELALRKIKNGDYGKCEKCGKRISKERLTVCPEARFCIKCLSR